MDISLAALKERFEPSSQKTRYQAELKAHKKMKIENWVDQAEDICLYSGQPSSGIWSEAEHTY